METLPQDRMQRWARDMAGMTISWIPQITAVRRDKPRGSQAAAQQQPMTEEDEKKRKATLMCDEPRILLQILLCQFGACAPPKLVLTRCRLG
jgi:hypothetical protein